MNKKQWYASAVIFYIAFIGTGSLSIVASVSEVGSITWLAGRIYSAFTWLLLAFGTICLACGQLEKEEGKKK